MQGRSQTPKQACKTKYRQTRGPGFQTGAAVFPCEIGPLCLRTGHGKSARFRRRAARAAASPQARKEACALCAVRHAPLLGILKKRGTAPCAGRERNRPRVRSRTGQPCLRGLPRTPPWGLPPPGRPAPVQRGAPPGRHSRPGRQNAAFQAWAARIALCSTGL